ncbi:hypothetical protein C8J57DRAFT_1462276 [Mycena rebaudengoi]|nr:hypothetical protein C8J57DRAFT_1462276 [Mycena rebaudengoi]
MSTLAELKLQGNALFNARNFAQADRRYTEAITMALNATVPDPNAIIPNATELDPRGTAVLYANRAACRTALGRYTDARNDAVEATQLDPTYAKGFARLATVQDAIGSYQESHLSWEKALDALPKANLKAVELLQKAQYRAALDAAVVASSARGDELMMDNDNNTYAVDPLASAGSSQGGREGLRRLPWEVAAGMIVVPHSGRRMDARDIGSSAWVIYKAHEDFMVGMRFMSAFEIDPVTGRYMGMRPGIAQLTNGVLRDVRVMHCTDVDFVSKYTKQAYESMSCNAWSESDPEVIIDAALARQREEGWAAARLAISLTIRAWIMAGVIEDVLLQKPDVAVGLFRRTLSVLQRLRESWVRAAKVERGVVFEDTFLFGVQRLLFEAGMESFTQNPDMIGLKELYDETDLFIQQADDNGSAPQASQEAMDPGFVNSFYFYPRGVAYAVKGLYYTQISRRNPSESGELARKAALEYVHAADCFPQDDEQHAWFLHCALDNMLSAGSSFTVRETLDLIRRIKASATKAKEIWEHSTRGVAGVWRVLEGVGVREDYLRDIIAEGRITLDAFVDAASG